MTEYPKIEALRQRVSEQPDLWIMRSLARPHETNSIILSDVLKEVDALLAERDALAAKAPMERKLREYKGVTYRGGSWHYRDMSAFMASALISGYCDTFTDADHAAIYALREQPYEPIESVEDVLREMYNVLGASKIVLPEFHEEVVDRLRAAVAAEMAQGEG